MGTGSFEIDNSQPPLASDALQIGVFRYNKDNADQPFELLPNVRCLRIDGREGPEPAVAQFEYVMDDSLALNFGWASQFEQLWPIDAQGKYVVHTDDRLVAMAQNPDGSPWYLFDGFAQIPQVDVTPDAQRVSFAAVGVAARAYDDVITGRVQRAAHDPTDTSGGSDAQTDLPCRFNPADDSVGAESQFRGNCTPAINFTRDTGNIAVRGGKGLGDFPVFIDPLLSEREKQQGQDEDPVEGAGDAGDLVSPWFVSDALEYLISQPSPADEFLQWPKFDHLDDLLNARYPPPGSGTFNPQTAQYADIFIRDYDATNKPLPEAIGELLGYSGFVYCWETTADGQGLPQTSMRIYRRDAANTQAPKLVFLDQPHEKIDPSKSNVTGIHLARDSNAVTNAFRVETAPKQLEVSIVLAPLYQPAAGDESAANRGQFNSTSLTGQPATVQRKYRWYGADECGDGHCNRTGQWVTGDHFEFADGKPAIFPDDSEGNPTHTVRYRPGSHTLVARDSNGKPLKAELSISFDYPGQWATPWDGTGTWQTISGGWRLLKDRLGIEVTAEKLEESWKCGDGNAWTLDFGDADQIVPGGLIHAIKWWSNPPSGAPTNGHPPALMLTTVIEADQRLDIEAGKRVASPTQFTRWRNADARDHFEYAAIHPCSIYYQQNKGNGRDPVAIRDDTKPALTHAYQLRAAHEFPPLAGSLLVPYLTPYYRIGDRICEIKGRNVSLQVNVGADQGESPVWPWIVGISWTMEGDRQGTTLYLTDRRSEVRNSW
jgi:hypothetical protein